MKFTIFIIIACMSFLLLINNDVKASQASHVTVCIHVKHETVEYTKYHVLNSYENVFDCPDPNPSKAANKASVHVRSTTPFQPNNVHATDPECIYTYTRI